MKLNAKLVVDIVIWFEKTTVFELGELMDKRKKLACQTQPYSKLIGDLGRDYRNAYANRKLMFSQLVYSYTQNEKISVNAAEHKARANEEYAALYRKENDLQGRWENGKRQSQSIDNVLSAMQQEIAQLRTELERTKKNQN